MTWLLLTLGFFLLMFGILSQAYSLKTKRGVLPPKSRIWRVLTRLLLFLAGAKWRYLIAAGALARAEEISPDLENRSIFENSVESLGCICWNFGCCIERLKSAKFHGRKCTALCTDERRRGMMECLLASMIMITTHDRTAATP